MFWKKGESSKVVKYVTVFMLCSNVKHTKHVVSSRWYLAVPTGYVLSGLFFNRTMNPDTLPDYANTFFSAGEWWNAASVDLASTMTQPKPSYDGLGWVRLQSKWKADEKFSYLWEHQDCWKTFPVAYFMKLKPICFILCLLYDSICVPSWIWHLHY